MFCKTRACWAWCCGWWLLSLSATVAHAGGPEAEGEASEGCVALDKAGYNLGLHIGAVFILLGVSLFGSFIPIFLSYWFKYKPILLAVKVGTFFGFGTILSTGFIHMLLAANENLSSDCLSEGWRNYEAWAFMFAVAAIVFMQLLDYIIEVITAARDPSVQCKEEVDTTEKQAEPAPEQHVCPECSEDVEAVNAAAVVARNELIPGHGHFVPLDSSQPVGFYFVEAGIVFHSFLIGLTLGVTSEEFVTLLIALSFHQFFEGLAVGSAAVETGLSKLACTFVALVYSITTPLGIAVGIAIRSRWNENSTTALLVQGILDALAAGILIYVVLVELITPMMTKSGWLRAQHPVVQVLCFAGFWSGAAVMAVIGAWA